MTLPLRRKHQTTPANQAATPFDSGFLFHRTGLIAARVTKSFRLACLGLLVSGAGLVAQDSAGVYQSPEQRMHLSQQQNADAAFYAPPVHVQPPARQNGSSRSQFVPSKGPLHEFRQRQFTLASPPRRKGPDLQTRISNMLKAPRYQSRQNGPVEHVATASYQQSSQRPRQQFPAASVDERQRVQEMQSAPDARRQSAAHQQPAVDPQFVTNEHQWSGEQTGSRSVLATGPDDVQRIPRRQSARQVPNPQSAGPRLDHDTRFESRTVMPTRMELPVPEANGEFGDGDELPTLMNQPERVAAAIDVGGEQSEGWDAGPANGSVPSSAVEDMEPFEVQGFDSAEPVELVADAGLDQPRSARLDENGHPISVLEQQGKASRFKSANYRLPGRGVPQDDDAFGPIESTNPQENQLPEQNSGLRDQLDAFDRNLEELREDPQDQTLEQLPEMDLQGNDDLDTKPIEKSCDEFRDQLLKNPIRNISLDISPPRSTVRGNLANESRTWLDRFGNVLGTGTLVDLRRGYLIIDGNGGQQKISYARLGDADLAAIGEFWNIPIGCTIGKSPYMGRSFIPQTTTWTASSLCHKPLYFENIQLERYGHSHGPFLQPVHSSLHFFASLVTVPYQSAIHPPNECLYALGFYRPGDCAPWLKDPIPLSLAGATNQALWTTGFALLP